VNFKTWQYINKKQKNISQGGEREIEQQDELRKERYNLGTPKI
jgi:hypothetical protein